MILLSRTTMESVAPLGRRKWRNLGRSWVKPSSPTQLAHHRLWKRMVDFFLLANRAQAGSRNVGLSRRRRGKERGPSMSHAGSKSRILFPKVLEQNGDGAPTTSTRVCVTANSFNDAKKYGRHAELFFFSCCETCDVRRTRPNQDTRASKARFFFFVGWGQF